MKKHEQDEEVWDSRDRYTDGGEDAGEGAAAAGGEEKPPEGGDKPPEEEPKPPAEETVPLSALKSERLVRQNLEQNYATVSEQLRLMQASQPQGAEQGGISIGDEDIVTGKEFKAALASLGEKYSKAAQSTNDASSGVVAELMVKADFNDYNKVIRENLVTVLESSPKIQAALKATPEAHRPLMAYLIGTLDPNYKKEASNSEADKIAKKLAEKSKLPGSVNLASGKADETDLSKIIQKESSVDFEKRIAAAKARQPA